MGALDVGEEEPRVEAVDATAVVVLATVDVAAAVVAAVVEADVGWTTVGVVVETALVVFRKHEQPAITAV